MLDTRNYAVVTGAYWAFTLTDGALRMLVLLHFHTMGYSPLDLAFLFLFYEAMGIVTNLVGGWIGARFGLRITLFVGLMIQILALTILSFVQPGWAIAFSVVYVMSAQALSGVAKDLVKMSSKSAVKLVAGGAPTDRDDHGLLFKWVALLTGSKNALKGIGFLLGGVLLQELGFQLSLWAMAAMLIGVLAVTVSTVTMELGRAKTPISKRDVFSKSREINILSAARIFLFGSRDVWFVVGVPVFLHSQLGWSFQETGAFMATWVIGYGFVQAGAPKLLKNTRSAVAGARAARGWGFVLMALPAILAFGFDTGWASADEGLFLIIGLFVFGAVFAVNSSIHSFLIVAYSDHDKVALNVGFYYMANAIGRLGGTFLSGLVYQLAGLNACLCTSAAMLALACLFTLGLPTRETTPA